MNARQKSLLLSVVCACAGAAIGATATVSAVHAQWAGTPWTGVRYLERTDPGPRRVRALEVDLCEAGMTIRASEPAEANRTVSSWGASVGVNAAVNANMWHCGALCGVGIGNGHAFDAPDDGHWGYLSFSPDDVAYPWDPDTVPPPPWVEQAVGGHPRVVNGGAPIPEFAGNCLERHPRTSAGFSADHEKLIFAVVDGRSSTSVGMTCAELAALMVSLGAHDAINLDGGGSSTMWLSDRGVVNRPSDGSERVVRNSVGMVSRGEGAPRYCASHRALGVDVGVMRSIDAATSAAWGFDLADLRLWPMEYIDAYPAGTALEAPRLVRAESAPEVYLVDHGFRRHVQNPTSLRGFHLHRIPIEVLSRAEVDAFPDGPPLTQFPYIAVGPPPHRAFLVDYALPEPPVLTTDGGVGHTDGGGVTLDDGGVVARGDGASTPLDGGERSDAGASSSVTGGCSVTPSHAHAGARRSMLGAGVLFALALPMGWRRRRARRR